MEPIRLSAREREAYTLGRLRFERGDVEGTLEAFGTLLESQQGFADVHYMVGVMQERQGELDDAEASLRRAVEINPGYAEALLALAAVEERRGNYDASRSLSERAASTSRRVSPGALDPVTRGKLANLQAAVADAYAEVGDFREAVYGYRKALEGCPSFHDIRHRLGIALRQAGLPHKATVEFERVLRGNPNFLEARLQLGLTYYAMGRANDALAQWERALEEDPTLEQAAMYLRLVRAAKASGAPMHGGPAAAPEPPAGRGAHSAA